MKQIRKSIKVVLLFIAVFVVLAYYYIKMHPLVFNESLWEHAHCMPQATKCLAFYAMDHGERFPFHTNGYGDALLLAAPGENYYMFSGPGYSTKVFEEARASKSNVDETLCGRVYVQGLCLTNDPSIALLFDKVAAPPDHCHFPRRLFAGYVREVGFIDGNEKSIPVEEWDAFAKQQIELLVSAGFSQEHAQQLYAEIK